MRGKFQSWRNFVVRQPTVLIPVVSLLTLPYALVLRASEVLDNMDVARLRDGIVHRDRGYTVYQKWKFSFYHLSNLT